MQVPSNQSIVFVAINMIHMEQLTPVTQTVKEILTKYVEDHGQTLCMKLQVIS